MSASSAFQGTDKTHEENGVRVCEISQLFGDRHERPLEAGHVSEAARGGMFVVRTCRRCVLDKARRVQRGRRGQHDGFRRKRGSRM